MLCAKYDYKMDISVKQEEAREDGIAIGIQQGSQQQAIKTAIKMLKKEYPINDISELTSLSPEKILELQEQLTENKKREETK